MSEKPDLRFARSRINPSGGFDLIEDFEKNHQIRPFTAHPENAKTRYRVGPKLQGRLERLARARFDIRKLTMQDIETWRTATTEPSLELAQSVNASSEIENEHIRAEELSLVLAAVTESEDKVKTRELSQRALAVKSIYETYLWALTLDRRTYIDFDLVLELHSRMFLSTKADVAGRLKTKEVSIRGAGYNVSTLPASQVPEYLRVLCTSTNDRLTQAAKHAEESMLLITAEFILDFLAIHPFEDGNGRTARLLSTYLLERSGYHFARFYPLDSIILETRGEYYEALFYSQFDWWGKSEDLTPWVEYYVNAVYSQYLRAYQRVRDKYSNELIDHPGHA